VVRRLWVQPPAGHTFTAVGERTARRAALLREWGERPWAGSLRWLIEEALEMRERLLTGADAGAPVLLHGDFHHGNVLAADHLPWLAIGPEPLVGDPAYVARLVRDRLETLVASPSAGSVARRRLSKLA